MSLRSKTRGANLVDNQKKGVVLRAREPNTDLGQEAPVPVDGTKTGPALKERGSQRPPCTSTGDSEGGLRCVHSHNLDLTSSDRSSGHLVEQAHGTVWPVCTPLSRYS